MIHNWWLIIFSLKKLSNKHRNSLYQHQGNPDSCPCHHQLIQHWFKLQQRQLIISCPHWPWPDSNREICQIIILTIKVGFRGQLLAMPWSSLGFKVWFQWILKTNNRWIKLLKQWWMRIIIIKVSIAWYPWIVREFQNCCQGHPSLSCFYP